MQAKFRFIALLILILTEIQPMFSQNYVYFGNNYLFSGKNDLQKENLKGHVYRVITSTYDAANKFGEDVKEDRQFLNTTYFNEYGLYWKSVSYKYITRNSATNWGLSESHIYKYNYNNQKQLTSIEDEFYKEPDSKYEKITYEYLSDGKIKEQNVYNKYGSLEWKLKFQYFVDKTIVNLYRSNGSLARTYTIDKDGIFAVGNIILIGDRLEQRFDSSGKILEEKTLFIRDDGTEDISGWSKYDYNSHGDLMTIVNEVHLLVDEYSVCKYEYEYDKYGNWVIRKKYEDGHITEWTERGITYASSDKEIAQMIYSEKRREFVRDSIAQRNQFIQDSLTIRREFVRDSIAQRNQFIQDSLTIRRKFVRDSLDNRIKFVQDSLTQIAKAKEIREQQFYAWLENVTREYVESNRGRSAVLYSLTGESVLLPWKLKTKDGNITSFFKKGHTFDFILNRKESLADITFEDMVRIPLKDSDIDCIMVFFTEDKKYALLFFEEWAHDTSRYHCKLACLATQSGDNTDTKVFAFSSKCQKEIMEYYNNNAPKKNQYLY